MAIKISQGFKRTSGDPIDETLTLTFAQMKAVDDSGMPEKYFTVCQDDGKLYLYNKNNIVDQTTGKFRLFEGGVPEGGTTGQILAKNSDSDGDAGWIGDIGRDLNKLVEWGSHTSQSPRTEYVPDIIDDSTVAILKIPIQGSALAGIEATKESLKQYLKTRFKIRYQTQLSTEELTTTTEDVDVGTNNFGMKTNLHSDVIDSELDIFLDKTTISNDTLFLAVNYLVEFPSHTTHREKPTNVVLVANTGYTFGIIDVTDPYYIHNSTKIALEDLKINNMNFPTSWGVAKAGRLTFAFTSQSQQIVDMTIDISELGMTNPADYEVQLTITGGGTMDWGAGDIFVYEKTTSRICVTYRNITSSVKDHAIVDYVIIAKGYGNIIESGSSLPTGGTTGQALVKKSDTDGDVEWKTVEGTGIVDTEMSGTSVNAVQNKVIKDYVDSKEPDAITNQEIDTIIFG